MCEKSAPNQQKQQQRGNKLHTNSIAGLEPNAHCIAFNRFYRLNMWNISFPRANIQTKNASSCSLLLVCCEKLNEIFLRPINLDINFKTIYIFLKYFTFAHTLHEHTYFIIHTQRDLSGKIRNANK